MLTAGAEESQAQRALQGGARCEDATVAGADQLPCDLLTWFVRTDHDRGLDAARLQLIWRAQVGDAVIVHLAHPHVSTLAGGDRRQVDVGRPDELRPGGIFGQ